MGRLLECDFSGIEALMVGYFSGDPAYIRLAKLGIHGYVQSHVLNRDGLIKEPISTAWSDADIKACIKELKEKFDPEYNQSKRCVHGVSYGLTEFGMSDYFPDVFPNRASARKIMDIFFEVCPKLKPWHNKICKAAHEKQMLGGPSPDRGETPGAKYWEMMTGNWHPYGYRCEFYGVLNYRKDKGEWKASRGDDAKKAIAYFPQSGAAGRLAEAELQLFVPGLPDYIGDAYFGRTPLRAPIHDSLFLEVPDSKVEEVKEKVARVMMRPSKFWPMPKEWELGDYLTIGVSMEIGKNWAPKTEKNPEGMQKVGVEDFAADVYRDEEEEEEVSA